MTHRFFLVKIDSIYQCRHLWHGFVSKSRFSHRYHMQNPYKITKRAFPKRGDLSPLKEALRKPWILMIFHVETIVFLSCLPRPEDIKTDALLWYGTDPVCVQDRKSFFW